MTIDQRNAQLLSSMGVPAEHHAAIVSWVRDEGTDVFGTPAYDALFTYWLHSGEMPYGTAKARDGDPDVWIKNRLTEMGVK